MMNPTAAVVGGQGAAGTTGAPQFASLYVGDLDPEVTEAMLYEIFNTVGPVASIRVCRDSVTRRSLGYAYVNFHSAADAERVMDTLNYSTIRGRCCRIMWSHRDPNLRKTGNGNVFVKNLDKNVDNKALYDTFSLFGNILSCKVATDMDGKSRGYGFVHYETAEAAKQAIEKVNGMQIGEKTVYVGEFIPRDGRSPSEPTNFTNLYVKGYPDEWEEEKLLDLMKEHGAITSSMVQKDKKGRWFAFVNYEKAEEAKSAIDTLHGKDFRSEEEKKEFPEGKPRAEDDKTIPADDHPEHLFFCQRAMTKSEREQVLKAKFAKAQSNTPVGVNLYIKNLSDDVDDAALTEMFKPYGEVTSARVMTDTKQRSKGFGFVCYKTPDEATKAVTEMHLKTVKGKPLYVGLAEKKDERSSRLAARYKGGKDSKGGLVTFDGKGGNMMGGNPMMGKGGMPGGFQQQWNPQMQQMNMMGQKGMPQMGGQAPMFPGQMAARPPMMPGQPYNPQMMQQQMLAAGKNPMLLQSQLAAAGKGAAGPMGMMGMNMPGLPMGGAGKGMNPMGPGAPMNQMPGAPGGAPGAPGGAPMGMNGAPGQGPRPGGAPAGAPGVPGAPAPGGAPGAAPGGNPAPLTAATLANSPPGMQKQMLGERLYPAVSRLQPELAGKITGMMLEMDNSEVLLMIESPQQLQQKVDEAMRVLNQLNNK
jgi:polyadenylate-binding protein